MIQVARTILIDAALGDRCILYATIEHILLSGYSFARIVRLGEKLGLHSSVCIATLADIYGLDNLTFIN